MNPFEKLLMIIVPCVGLSAIFYFFTMYLPDVENGHYYDTQRLQGQTQIKQTARITSTPIFKDKIVVKKDNLIFKKMPNNRSISRPSTRTVNKQPQKQYDPYLAELQHYDYLRIQNEQQIYEERRRVLRKKQQHKNYNNQKCAYYQKMKDQIRDRMRRKYKASQYNWLKKQKRHWAKLYSDNCFSGYQYPR